MNVIQLCGSFGERCGIARYTQYVADTLSLLGINNRIVRSCGQLDALLRADEAAGQSEPTLVLVQHEYGIYDMLGELASGDSTGNIIATLTELSTRGRIRAAAFIMHTIVARDHVLSFANKQLFTSPFPVFHLNRLGAAQGGVEFLEHGVYRMPGSNLDRMLKGEMDIDAFAERQLATKSVGTFGLLSPNKMPRRIIELAGAHNLELKANFASRSKVDPKRLLRFLEEAHVTGAIGFDFLSEEDLLRTIETASFVGSFQEDFNHYATSGSTRFLLNSGVPLIVNSVTCFMDLSEVAVFVDDSRSELLARMMVDRDLYKSKIADVVRFSRDNTMERVYERLMNDAVHHFDQKKDSKQRYVYYYQNLMSTPSLKDAVRFFGIDEPNLTAAGVVNAVNRRFSAVAPKSVWDSYLDTSKSISDPELLEEFDPRFDPKAQPVWTRESDDPRPADSTADLRRANSALTAWTPPTLSRLAMLPPSRWAEYLSRAGGVADSNALQTINAIAPDATVGDRLRIAAEALGGHQMRTPGHGAHLIDDALARTVFYSSEIDSLPTAERAYCAALLLDRQPPDEGRLKLFKHLFDNGASIADFVGTSEFENALIDLADGGASTRFGKAAFGTNFTATLEGRSSRVAFWRQFIRRRFNLPASAGEFDALNPGEILDVRPGEPDRAGWTEFGTTMRNQRFRFPVAAMEPFAGLAGDRPWFEIALYALSLKNARIVTSHKEFISSWTRAQQVFSQDEELPEFDFFLLHKDAARAFIPLLERRRPTPCLAFANEVFFVVSDLSKIARRYDGVHGGGFIAPPSEPAPEFAPAPLAAAAPMAAQAPSAEPDAATAAAVAAHPQPWEV